MQTAQSAVISIHQSSVLSHSWSAPLVGNQVFCKVSLLKYRWSSKARTVTLYTEASKHLLWLEVTTSSAGGCRSSPQLVAVGNIYLSVPSALYSPAAKIHAVVINSSIHFLISWIIWDWNFCMEVKRNLPKPSKRNGNLIHRQDVPLCSVFWVVFNVCCRTCLCCHVDQLLIPGIRAKIALIFYSCWGACSGALFPRSAWPSPDTASCCSLDPALVTRDMGAWPSPSYSEEAVGCCEVPFQSPLLQAEQPSDLNRSSYGFLLTHHHLHSHAFDTP